MTKRRGVSAEFVYVAFVRSKTKLDFGYKIIKVLNYWNNNYRVTKFFFKKNHLYLHYLSPKLLFKYIYNTIYLGQKQLLTFNNILRKKTAFAS